MTAVTGPLALVDPYDAGVLLASTFAACGVPLVHVASTPGHGTGEGACADPTHFAHHLPWSADVTVMAGGLRALGVVQVLAGSERGVPLADQLAEMLGLPGNGTALSLARRDKHRMIEQAGRCGIRVPAQICTDSPDAVEAWAAAGGHWPLILKPLLSKGGDGVRLCHDAAELRAAFAALHGRADRLGFRNERLLAQQFLRGHEYVVDVISLDGRHHPAGLWTYGKPPPGGDDVARIDTKHLLPGDHPLAASLFAFAARVFDALGIRHGAGHCELIVDDAGPVLVEAAARLHGGPAAHLLCRRATGSSQLDMLVRATIDPDGLRADHARLWGFAGAAGMVLLRRPANADRRALFATLPSLRELAWNSPPDAPAPPVAGLASLVHGDAAEVATDMAILTGHLSTRLLDRREAIAELAPAWGALLQRSGCNRAFGSPGWYLAALDSRPTLQPLLLAAFRGGELAGVLPLAMDDTGPVGFATDLADYNDVVVAAGDRAAARWLLLSARRQWPGLVLDNLRPDADLVAALSGPVTLAPPVTRCPHARLDGGYAGWLAGRSAAFRADLRRKRQQAAAAGLVVRALDPVQDEGLDVAGLFLDLHPQRFGAASLFGRDPVAARFVRAALPGLFRQGAALLFALWAGDRLAGLNICLRGVDSLGYWNAGFAADLARFSPGTLMLDAALRTACDLGLPEMDFLRGEEAYKMKWCNGSRQIGQLP